MSGRLQSESNQGREKKTSDDNDEDSDDDHFNDYDIWHDNDRRIYSENQTREAEDVRIYWQGGQHEGGWWLVLLVKTTTKRFSCTLRKSWPFRVIESVVHLMISSHKADSRANKAKRTRTSEWIRSVRLCRYSCMS